MERRVHRRFPRRVEIRFWRHGESQVHSSFTTNISRTGLFLGSASSLIPGERLRLEILDADKGFIVEGRVARVHRVSLALRHVEQPGVGVRFLQPEELVEEFLPVLARQAGRAVPVAATAEHVDDRPTESEPVAVPARAPEPPPAAPPPTPPPRQEPKSSDARIPTAPSPSDRKIVPVAFDDASAFLSVFHRDIQSGGLFVSSDAPAELNETVWIELRLPLDDERPELIPARVVQRFAPEAAVGTGRNLISGMALQFLDPERVVDHLKPKLAKLRR
jgi:Tfp pilus assembly protein PilZ